MFYNALEEIAMEKQYQEKCLLILVHALQSYNQGSHDSDDYRAELFAKYQLSVSSVLMATLPRHFPGTEKFIKISTLIDLHFPFSNLVLQLLQFFLCLKFSEF